VSFWSSQIREHGVRARLSQRNDARDLGKPLSDGRPIYQTLTKDIGAACEQVIAELLADNALYRLRAAQGVIGLADRHATSRLEAACAKAIAAGDPSYRTIKGILAAGTETDQLPACAGDGGAAAFLRGPASFANVIPLPGTITSDSVTATGEVSS
jgi:hypothetical protein